MIPPGAIWYVVILPAEGAGDYSIFQGFSANTVSICDALNRIGRLPASIGELFESREEVIRRRASGAGGYTIALLELEFLEQFSLPTDLVCMISTVQNRVLVDQHVRSHPEYRWLHVTTDPESGDTPSLWTLSRSMLTNWVLTAPELKLSAEQRDQLTVQANAAGRWPSRKVNTPSRRHNITSPTELALASVGIEMSGVQPLSCAEDQDYAEALAVASRELRQAREQALAGSYRIPGTPALIVSVPSVFRRLTGRRDLRGLSKPVRTTIGQVLRQRQYIAMRETGEMTAAILRDPAAQGALVMRANELRCYTSALAISGASLFCPVLRCPPQTDRVRELLTRLAGIIKGGNPTPERMSAMARKVGESLSYSIPQPILAEIQQCTSAGVKLIGDTPLEFLPVDGVPLALRSVTSRLPTLPGNLLMRHALLRRSLFLRPEQFMKVLLVRAFTPTDPIREVLRTAVECVTSTKDGSRVELIVVDVKTHEDLIDAFNAFDGVIAIFDGHASQEKGKAGALSVGDVTLNPFELYGRVRVPPILLLSACETYTMEGYEASVASGFLMMGCDSVLGTIAPIDALKAGTLIARFILRLSLFLPTLTQATPWSQVVSGMLWMSYVTDVLYAMKSRFSLSEHIFLDLYKKVQFFANVDINSFRPDWFERLLNAIARELGRPEHEISLAWRETCYFTETLRYVHFGQPEHIFILPQPRGSSEAEVKQ